MYGIASAPSGGCRATASFRLLSSSNFFMNTATHPDILATGWGDCVLATAQLTGKQRHYYGNSDLTGNLFGKLGAPDVSATKPTFTGEGKRTFSVP